MLDPETKRTRQDIHKGPIALDKGYALSTPPHKNRRLWSKLYDLMGLDVYLVDKPAVYHAYSAGHERTLLVNTSGLRSVEL